MGLLFVELCGATHSDRAVRRLRTARFLRSLYVTSELHTAGTYLAGAHGVFGL